MITGEPIRLSVCVDCLFVLANGAESEAEQRAAAGMARNWPGMDITLGRLHDECDHDDSDAERDACQEPWFSWQDCDGCGSTLGGNREYATAWKEDHTWVSGMMYMDSEDVQAVALMRREANESMPECKTCGAIYDPQTEDGQ